MSFWWTTSVAKSIASRVTDDEYFEIIRQTSSGTSGLLAWTIRAISSWV